MVRSQYWCYFRLLLLLFIVGGASPLAAQVVHDDWSSVETEHFRLHFPDDYRDWTLHLLPKLEAIHERVTTIVAYGPEQKTDILVVDPFRQSNGMALPLLHRPRIVLFTTTPDSSSSIGYYSDWPELVMTHEYVHVVHMVRPSRNPFQRFMHFLLPLGPITMKSPNWLIEGYATMLEGELTGLGRPNGSYRAMFLRTLAAAGQLPSYNELDGGSRWASGAYPYLFGSAFMEWLVEREGPDSFVHLWRRMTARRDRSFDEAFRGVFRLPPDELYGLFAAELTAKAVQIQKEMHDGDLRQGLLWARREGSTGKIALAPDGSMMAVVLYEKNAPPKLEIWSTTETDEEKDLKKMEEAIKKDAEDVPDKPWQPPRRKKLYSLPTLEGSPASNPVFMPDGKSLLVTRYMPDKYGDLHPDLFCWQFEKGTLRRITHQGDISLATPTGDGQQAIAIRGRFGKTELVAVDLRDGRITSLLGPSLEPRYFQPALSADGSQLAMLVHRDGHWRIELYKQETLELTAVIGDGREVLASLAWGPDNMLYFVSDRSGIPNVERFIPGSGSREQLTNEYHGALSPVPDNDSKLYFLSLWAKGLNIFHFDMKQSQNTLHDSEFTSDQYPLVPPRELPRVEPLVPRELPEITDYGFGRQELSSVSSFCITSSHTSIQAGIRVGDIIGRHETLLMGGYSRQTGFEGIMLRTSLRFLPMTMVFHGFHIDEGFQDIVSKETPASRYSDGRHSGAAFGVNGSWLWNSLGFSISSGYLLSRVAIEQTDHEKEVNRSLFDMSPEVTLWKSRDRLSVFTSLGYRFQNGTTDSDNWTRSLYTGYAMVRIWSFSMAFEYMRGQSSGDLSPIDLFSYGGHHSSLVPEIAVSQRINQPGIEPFQLHGRDLERSRVEVSLGDMPLTLFGERVLLKNDDRKPEGAFDIAGAELNMSLPFFPLINFSGSTLLLGVAKSFDRPFEDETRGYALLSLHPGI